MAVQFLRKLYAPEYMVKDGLKRGEIPGTRDVYKIGFGVAWASIVETFLIALISMADTVMVSVVGEHAIAAVGLVSQPRFIVQTLVFALNAAVTAIAARRKGEGDAEGAISCLKQGLILSALFSLVLSAIVYPIAEPFLRFTGAQDDTIGMAVSYFRIILTGVPLNSLSLTISAALRGTGNTRASMNINIIANVINMIFNYLLIGGNFGFPRLEVAGAAIATVIGWLCGLILAVFAVARKGEFLFIFTRDGWKFDRKTVSAMYRVSSGAFLEQICMRIGFFTYTKIIAGLGTLMFAAHQILINILNLSFSFGEGFGIAASSLVGQNLGAKRPDLSIVYGKVCQRMSFISSAAIFLLLTVCGEQMLGLFTKDPTIVAVSKTIMVIMGLIIFGQACQMIFMGALRGAGDTRYTAVVSMICIMLLRPGIAYVLAYPLGLGLVGAWISFLIDQYLRLFLTFRRFSSGKWMAIKL